MRNLFALVGAALIGFVGAGWYLGWYDVEVETTTAQNGHRKVNIDFDSAKMDADLHKGEARVEQAIDARRSQANTTGEQN
jgi:hypothetical protein